MTIKKKPVSRLAIAPVLALSLLVGCDDSDGKTVEECEGDAGEKQDAEVTMDAGEPDASPTPEDATATPIDATPADDGKPKPKLFALSKDGPDRLCDAVYDAQGNILAVGFRAAEATAESDRELIVAKFSPAGELDTTFGTQGVASKNVTVGGKAPAVTDCQGGGESARAIVLQGNYIYIGGTAETDPNATGLAATDTDIVLVRFTTAGQVDNTFGTQGVVRYDLSAGIAGRSSATATADSWIAPDRIWSLSAAPGDKLVIHGSTRSSVAAAYPHTDLALVRVNAADGSRDNSFDGDGVFTLDVLNVSNTARSATVLSDGSIVGSGYMTGPIPGLTGTLQNPVLYKVSSAGVLDAQFAIDPQSFGTGNYSTTAGVYFGVLTGPGQGAEAYAAGLQSDGKFVTMGYGASPVGSSFGSDFVSFRFTADGKYDRTYGTQGRVYLDVGGYSDNGRGMVVLPDDRVVGLGGGRQKPAMVPAGDAGTQPANVDAVIAVFTKDGKIDGSFGPQGFRAYDLGGTGDFFYGADVSDDKKSLAVVGYKGLGASSNDDSALLILPL